MTAIQWAWLVVAAVWLAWGVVQVNIDFDDGYSAIANAQYFLGITPEYFWQRGPAMAVLLVPAEWIAQHLALHPFDVHAHHAVMAVMHVGYLIGVSTLLYAHFGLRAATLMALLAALLTPVFFSYAPFISHDIFPGLLTLLMVVFAHRFMIGGSRRLWLILVLIGAGLALVKQTYAVVWAAVLLAQALLTVSDRTILPAVRRRRWMWLALAAVSSGVLTWIGYAAVLGGSIPDVPFWSRPLVMAQNISGHYDTDGGAAEALYQWVYLRNAPAYGAVCIVLLLPGLYFSLRSTDPLQRSVALVWLLLVVTLACIPFKEVRYLAFLAPLNAWLIVPAIDFGARERLARKALPLILVLDLGRSLPEAARLHAPFYRDAVREFLDPLPAPDQLPNRLLVERPLSFVSPDANAFYGDRYHRITHISLEQLRVLYGYEKSQLLQVKHTRELEQPELQPGDYVLMAMDLAVRRAPFVPGNKTTRHPDAVQAVARVVSVELVRESDAYRVLPPFHDATLILPRAGGTQAAPLIGSRRFEASSIRLLFPETSEPNHLPVRALHLLTICQVDGCRDLRAR